VKFKIVNLLGRIVGIVYVLGLVKDEREILPYKNRSNLR
jgi:hypothetical protein